MDTDKIVRTEASRVLRHIKEVGVLLLLTMTMLAAVVCAVVNNEGRKTREYIDNMQVKRMFDTQVLETWCKGKYIGTIRMVGAWPYEIHNGYITLEDEQGNLWDVGSVVAEDTFLLLWIADNNTLDITDDIIVKVWCDWTNQ